MNQQEDTQVEQPPAPAKRLSGAQRKKELKKAGTWQPHPKVLRGRRGT